jgi:hypothetical protein
MKVNLTLILGLATFVIVAYVVLMPAPKGGVARGPLFFFDTDPTTGPRQPRGGDDWTARKDLTR